jgi:diacylglycerol kinase
LKENGFLRSRINAIRIAFDGLFYVLRTQPNVKVYGAISLVVISVGLLSGISRMEWIILVFTIGLVWAAEVFNTAVESLVDLVSPEENAKAKIIKDVSAGAVLVSAIISVLVGLLIFGPRLISWVSKN